MGSNKTCHSTQLAIAFAASFSILLAGIARAGDTEKPKPKAAAAAVSKGAKGAAKLKITEQAAADRVMQLPEVKKFFKDVAKSKLAQPALDVDRKEGDAYVVHVYEVVNDGPSSSHTATKNWYYVNIKTGKITKEF